MAGRVPVLTTSQRGDLAEVLRHKRELRRKLRDLEDVVRDSRREQNRIRAQIAALPTVRKLAKRYGVADSTVMKSTEPYANLNPLDRIAKGMA